MGWASGRRLFSQVWGSIREYIPMGLRESVCKEVMQAFEREDCDTLEECFREDWPEVELAYYLLYPDLKE